MLKQICFFRKHPHMTADEFMDYYERDKVWNFFIDCHPFYADYQASTERVLPLVMMKAIEPIPVFRESDATGIRQS